MRSSEPISQVQKEERKPSPHDIKDFTEETINQKNAESSGLLCTPVSVTPFEDTVSHEMPKAEDKGNRVISNGSTQCSQTEINEMPKDLNLDALPTDKNGFVQYGLKNNNSNNRYSFISSTSTDYEPEWYDGQQHISMHMPSMTLSLIHI